MRSTFRFRIIQKVQLPLLHERTLRSFQIMHVYSCKHLNGRFSVSFPNLWRIAGMRSHFADDWTVHTKLCRCCNVTEKIHALAPCGTSLVLWKLQNMQHDPDMRLRDARVLCCVASTRTCVADGGWKSALQPKIYQKTACCGSIKRSGRVQSHQNGHDNSFMEDSSCKRQKIVRDPI